VALWLKLEGTPGDSPKSIAEEMVDISRRLQIGVHVNINGVDLVTIGKDDPDDLVDIFYRTLAYRRNSNKG